MPAASPAVGGLRRFFDISVPRNIAPDITEEVAGRVFNVDDLKEVVSKNKEERRKAADEAQVLLDQEQLSFEAWRDSLETVPTIKVGHHLLLCSSKISAQYFSPSNMSAKLIWIFLPSCKIFGFIRSV